MKRDRLEDMIRDLKGQLPKPRTGLSESEKDELIQQVGGVLTAMNIIKAQAEFPQNRIPFLFNNLDSQAVVDLMANDMQAALERAKRWRELKKPSKIKGQP